ncbi:MAG TPA: AMP-binding protein, partial [Thermoguttaceae bacterium]|nr:AMP-binding protein [Thermoguttaceae bacterium]
MSRRIRPPEPPSDLRTLASVLQWRAQTTPDAPAFTFLTDGETPQATWTYADLDQRARSIGAHLQALGAADQRVLLLFEAGLEFTASFYGCCYAGALPVPVNPPDLFR